MVSIDARPRTVAAEGAGVADGETLAAEVADTVQRALAPAGPETVQTRR